MDSRKDLEQQVFLGARDNGISSVLFRNATRRKLGLNITDSECLSMLSIKGTATPTELARFTGLTTGSTTAMLDRLEKLGYIRRRPNPVDRRGVVIEISEQWGRAAGPLVAGVQQAHHALISSYSDEELQIIAGFLRRFTENVTTATREIEQDLS